LHLIKIANVLNSVVLFHVVLDAQYNLGVCYYSGHGVGEDLKEAVRLYRLAAEKGDADAQCNLGWCYQEGIGISKNLTEAARWYELATSQQHERALQNLKRLQTQNKP